MISFHCEISSQAMEIVNNIECHNCARIIEEDEVSDSVTTEDSYSGKQSSGFAVI